jgi:CxxC-x17-CxxC domain-containing protein
MCLLTLQEKKFETKCFECGKKAIVPFKPKEGRKIFCKHCYNKQRLKKSRNIDSKNNLSSNSTWARRTKGFRGRKEKKPSSILHT